MKHHLRIFFLIASLTTGGILHAAGIEPPVPIRTVVPEYPAALRDNRVSGLVTMNCSVDERGVVTEAKVVKTTNEAFNQSAIAAVAKWRFRPAHQDGKPVAVVISLPIRFSTDGES